MQDCANAVIASAITESITATVVVVACVWFLAKVFTS